MMAEVMGGAQGSTVMAALRASGKLRSRVQDAAQRGAVRRRAGTQIRA